jgi:hypothetical protein
MNLSDATPALETTSGKVRGMEKLGAIEQAQQAIIRTQGAVTRAQGAVARCLAALERAKDITDQSRAEYQMLQARTEETIVGSEILMSASAWREVERTEEAYQCLSAGED